MILVGDCRETLRALPERSVQTCVTSPPYFGLRDYGHDGQIGLEPTPDEFVQALVAVFREVRRVLRDDGTVWLNLGDSYSGAPKGNPGDFGSIGRPNVTKVEKAGAYRKDNLPGIKSKDLIGIPWECAKALRAPYYAGEIKAERDRVWLAATIDAEGSICGFTHERADGDGTRTGVHVTMTNTNERLLDEAHRIWPASRVEHENHGAGHFGRRPSWRWVPHGAERKALLMREMYPYLIAKREQARLAYALFALSVDAKRLGHSPQRDEVRGKRAWIVDALSRLNQGDDVDVPAWVGEPPSVLEPGWYLRSDIIWNKPNPMPESVTDRPTKSHEYLFLLSKGPRYFYDADAIREPQVIPVEHNRARIIGRGDQGYSVASAGPNGAPQQDNTGGFPSDYERGRNRRSVWTVATQPFPGAHFATFPPKLIEPCVLAGTSPKACGTCGAPWQRVTERTPMVVRPSDRVQTRDQIEARTATSGTMTEPPTSRTVGWEPSCAHNDDTGTCIVLDPFAGSGTVGVVCGWHGREFVGCELNPEYAAMAEARIALEGRPGGKPAHHEPVRVIAEQMGLL